MTRQERDELQEVIDNLDLWSSGFRPHGSEKSAMMMCMADAKKMLESLRTRVSRYEPPSLDDEYGPISQA